MLTFNIGPETTKLQIRNLIKQLDQKIARDNVRYMLNDVRAKVDKSNIDLKVALYKALNDRNRR